MNNMQFTNTIINTNNIKPNSITRNHALDFTKGFLVVVMVAYHMLNYFLCGGGKVYMFLNYVTGAFIFISGLLCSTIYYNKYLDNKQYVHQRLLTRGLKLITIFFSLNIFILFFIDKNNNNHVSAIIKNLDSILIEGNDQIMAFPILLPIAYVLLISNLLFYYYRLRLILFSLLIFAFIIISFNNIKIGYNLYGILIGIGGFFTGFIYPSIIPKMRKNILKLILIFLAILYFFVAVPLGIKRIYFIYYIVVNIVLANIYFLGIWLDPSKMITKNIIIFGQYSLFLYIAQIIIIRNLAMIIRINSQYLNIAHLILFIFTNFCLAFLCDILILSRKKFKIINKVYQLIFA